MTMRLHHIGIAVDDLEEAMNFYTKILGLKVEQVINRPGFKAALISIGDMYFELIVPEEDPHNQVSKSLVNLLKERKGGVHHFAFEVDNLLEELDNLKRKGVKFTNEIPLRSPGGAFTWLEENSVDGIMIELCDKGYTIT